MRKYLLIFFLCAFAFLDQLPPFSSTANPEAKVATLMKNLAWKTINNGSGLIFEPPKERDRKQVLGELLRIAKKSPNGRAAVIKGMIQVSSKTMTRTN